MIEANWLENKNGYYLCGNSTGSRPCPQNYTCLRGADVNTYISNFNFYGSSVVTISQLMTLHFWQELYQKMLLTAGTLHVSYFILAFYSFLYSSGLILAIITRSYKNVLKEFEIIEKKSRLAKKDGSYICDSQKGIVKSPSCKSYELFSSQVISSERVERQASEIIENTNRAAERNFESDSGLKEHLAESRQKREAVRCQLAREKSTESNDQSANTSACSSVFRQHLKRFISNFSTELFFLTSIASYLCIVIVQYSNLNFIPLEIALYCYYDLGFNPREGRDVCKCVVPMWQGELHSPNSRKTQAASLPMELGRGEEKWEAPSDLLQGVLPQNLDGAEPNRTVTYMVFKATTNDRHASSPLPQ
ncbi:sodium channel protein PaFPC1 [Trichonephila clavipes]|nr:sodium channel protein PaFPC1 [Trichonephila clavipes]